MNKLVIGTAAFFVCFLAVCTVSAKIFNTPCTPGCASTPGGAVTVPIDMDESEYSCCNAVGACTVCDACPWYLEFWC